VTTASAAGSTGIRHGRDSVAMTERLSFAKAAPELYKQISALDAHVAGHIDPVLYELVKLRASLINQCAFCIDMHSSDALTAGESAARLFGLGAWHETPLYTDRERAALGWTEALTRLSEGREHESAYQALKAHFTGEEQVKLTLTINLINGWNRLAVGFGVFADPAAIRSAVQAVANQ